MLPRAVVMVRCVNTASLTCIMMMVAIVGMFVMPMLVAGALLLPRSSILFFVRVDGEAVAVDAVGGGWFKVKMEQMMEQLRKRGFERVRVRAERDERAENHVARGAASEVESNEFHGVSFFGNFIQSPNVLFHSGGSKRRCPSA